MVPRAGVVVGRALVLIELLVVCKMEVDMWGTLEAGWVAGMTGGGGVPTGDDVICWGRGAVLHVVVLAKL